MPSNQHANWALILNSNDCRIYKLSTKPYQLTLLKEILHPESKLRDIDLTSDKPGRYKAGDSAHGAYTQHSDPKEIQIEDFSRQVANELNKGRNIEAGDKLPAKQKEILLKAKQELRLLVEGKNQYRVK